MALPSREVDCEQPRNESIVNKEGANGQDQKGNRHTPCACYPEDLVHKGKLG